MKNIKQNPKAIELHKVAMECIDTSVKNGWDNNDALREVASFIDSYKNYDPDVLIASLKMQFLNKPLKSVSDELISKIID